MLDKKPPVKCPVCNEYFQRETVIYEHYKNRYYHKKCFELKNSEVSDKEKLTKYIERLFHKKIDAKIKNQLTMFGKKGYSSRDMYNALYYFFEIKNNSLTKANGGIGIVPYVIDEAREYFTLQENRAANITHIDPITEQRQVTITDPGKKLKYRLRTIINISEL